MAFDFAHITRPVMIGAIAKLYGDTTAEELADWEQLWLVNYMFVKQLGPNEALYVVAVHDPDVAMYEGMWLNYARLTEENGGLCFEWATDWAPAQ